MSKGLKIFLIILGLACGGGVIIMGAGFLFFKTQGPGLVQDSKKVVAEAGVYGKGKKDLACVVQVMKRSESCGEYDIKCQVSGAVYLQGCLRAATATKKLCEGVPSESKLMDSVKWRIAVCKTYPKVKPRVCQSIQAMVQKQCKARE